MLKRDWLQHVTAGRVIGAVVVLGIAGIAWVSLRPDPPKIPEYQKLEKLEGQQQAPHASCDPKRLAAIRSDSKRLAKADECAQAAHDYGVQQESLKQALRVTNASEEGLWLTYQGARTNVASAVLLFLTLAATAWAAYAASEATRHAKASETDVKESLRLSGEVAKAANQANVLAEEHSRTRLRAYVHVESARVVFGSDGPRFTVTVINTGQTPAKMFYLGAVAEAMSADGGKHTLRPPRDKIEIVGWRGLGSGKDLTATVKTNLLNDCSLATLKTSGQMLSLKGMVTYEDIFGESYISEFLFFTFSGFMRTVDKNGTVQSPQAKMFSSPGVTQMYAKL